VNNKRLYHIAISGLPAAACSYSFDIDEDFFAGANACEVRGGRLEAVVRVEKKSDFLQLDIQITGEVSVLCDRCLDEMFVPVQFHGTPVVKFAEENTDPLLDDETVLWAPHGARELDMAPYLYDSIILSLPLQRIHPEGECNKEMTDRIINF
jgi:uncharacterized metal-binding protein YceD (DUF177 family)